MFDVWFIQTPLTYRLVVLLTFVYSYIRTWHVATPPTPSHPFAPLRTVAYPIGATRCHCIPLRTTAYHSVPPLPLSLLPTPPYIRFDSLIVACYWISVMNWPRNRDLTYLYSTTWIYCRNPSCFRGMHTCTFIYWFIGFIRWGNKPSSFFHLSTDTHTHITEYVRSFDKPIPLLYPQINVFQVPPLETYSYCANMGPLRGGGAGLFRRYSVFRRGHDGNYEWVRLF